MRASLALMSPMIGADAWAQCATYSSTDIANAINSSSTANAALKATACTWGGAGKSESGGNTCSSNGSNFGVLQLSSGNLAGTGYTAQQYLALPLQQQVNVWAMQAGNSGAGSGNVATISTAAASGQSFGSTPATRGMAAACVQFGSVICKNDLAALNAGQPCGGASPVPASYSVAQSSWTEDGNGQTICSWGKNIQANINSCAAAPCPAGSAGAPAVTTAPVAPGLLPSAGV
jgi:hypothetical protein